MEHRAARPAFLLKPWAMAAVVCGLVLACYWPVLHGGLVWDDAAHVTRPELRSWAGLGRIWSDLHATQQYYPVLHSAFWIEHRLWGDATVGYHLLNLALHALACCLLALALQRLWVLSPDRAPAGPQRVPPAGAAWLAALLFAVHPVCVESVAWISEQKNTLSLVFYLLAALVYLDFHVTRKRGRYALALACFILALATKSVTATLPAALLVVLWWRKGTLSWRRDVLPLLPWFLVALAAGLFTVWIERTIIGAEGAAYDLSPGQRLLLAGRVVWFYLGKLAWPADLMFIYPHWDLAAQAARGYAGLAGVFAVTLSLWRLRPRSRGALAGWLFFVGSLFPALGFFNVYPFIFSYVADHFQYLAAAGALATAATGLTLLLERTSRSLRAAGWTACGVVVLLLAVLSRRQSRMYVNGEILYRTTIAQNPTCWLALNNLANELRKSPVHKSEAIACYEAALRIRPEYPEAHNNLGVELAKIPGREPEAITHYERALQLRPDYAEAHSNLAIEFAKQPDRMPEALTQFKEALRLKPNYPEVHYNFANVLAQLPGHVPDAVAEYRAALRLNPEYVEAHYNLANTLAPLPGRESQAEAHYEEALRLRPGYADAHVALANLLARQPGRVPDALAHYRAALRLEPDVAGVHFNLAGLLAKQPGRTAEALAQYEEALRLQPGYLDAHIAYAGELAGLPGRVPDAVAQYNQALQIDPDLAGVQYNLAVQLSRLPGHMAEAMAHYEAALRLQPDYAAALNNLAILYAQQGRLHEAEKHWQKALTLEPDNEDARRNLDRLHRLKARQSDPSHPTR
jgi:tetratricopeptide (TPR) repeat protein